MFITLIFTITKSEDHIFGSEFSIPVRMVQILTPKLLFYAVDDSLLGALLIVHFTPSSNRDLRA
ncbi:hypothetical protein AYI68_g5514, partial [Smittium mucronatum]